MTRILALIAAASLVACGPSPKSAPSASREGLLPPEYEAPRSFDLNGAGKAPPPSAAPSATGAPAVPAPR